MRTSLFLLTIAALLGACVKDGSTGKPPNLPPRTDDASWTPPAVSDALFIVPSSDALVDTFVAPVDTAKDTAIVKRDSAVTTNPDTEIPTGGGCDLLKQNCVNKAMACYPVNNAGTCQMAGGVGETGSCFLGADPPLCAPGLACITGVLFGAVCLTMCDVYNPVPYCGQGSLCQPLPKFTSIGYCQPG